MCYLLQCVHKKTKETKMLVRLPIDVDKKDRISFKAAAAANDLSMSEVINNFIRAYARNPKIYNLIIQDE